MRHHGHDHHHTGPGGGHDEGTDAAASSPTDPTFYRSPAEAIAAPREKLAYVVAFDRAAERPDALTVVDLDPD